MTRGLLAGALAALMLAAPADAHHLPVSAEWMVRQSVPVADAAWPGSPCAGRLDVRIDPAAVADLDARSTPGEQVNGFAPGGGSCSVLVRVPLPPEVFCRILAHEAGHAAGAGHSSDPGSLMFPEGPAAGFAPCRVLEQPVHFLAWVRERTAARRGHAWSCHGTSRVQVCRGRPVRPARMVARAEFVRQPDGLVDESIAYTPATTKRPRH